MNPAVAWYRAGGPVMHVILLAGAIGLAILVERMYMILARWKPNGRRFIEHVIQLVHAGRIDEAIKECAGSGAALSDIGLLILRSRSLDPAELQNVADVASLVVVPNLRRRLHALRVTSIVTLLLGVLGTLIELHGVLDSAASVPGQDHAAAIAPGLAAALNPICFALVVAIMLVVGRGYLAGQTERIGDQIREFSARLINALVDRPDVRLGHR